MSGEIQMLVRSKCPAVSVGVVSADQMNLGQDMRELESLGCGFAHFDLMDSSFVPLLTAGPWYVKAVKTTMFKDVHLLVDRPERFVEDCVHAGADMITVHPESSHHIHASLQKIRRATNANDPERGVLAGVALNPSTPLSVLEPLFPLVDMVVLVAINAGFADQSYLPETAQRVKNVRDMSTRAGRDVLVMIDGGVTGKNIAEVASAKADLVVSGSAVFKGGGPSENLPAFMEALER